MTPERYQRLLQILTMRQPDLTVLMDNVHKSHNLSAILRNCDATGVFEAHAVYDRTTIRPNRGISSSSGKWVKVRTHQSIHAALDHFKQQNMQLVVADVSPNSIDFREVDYTHPTVIVLGAEKSGPDEEVIQQADHIVTIPMDGMVDSLNVSVAAALILFEAHRQRKQAGMYESSRLPEDVFQKTLFEWAHPVLARFYRRKKLAYPPLREDGEVIEQDEHVQARTGLEN
ncbi:MAG: tRNA (guanosine(18)-2'-O)-methyltransferase TrmH [Gammaproteobacteria bacterium]|nr:tRNA (guanosine(18)-2'-O)-methyltransferase TrmH [Gammaproteobacteria bacterium]MDH5777806.1 tRNA (guanosine(18)-2'-O)-methyltransferase TrmH [Gammaproteobacteria bacterium]